MTTELGAVHLVGIGGAGMSGIARVLLARGTRVSGSDAKQSRAVDELRALGAVVHVGHDAAHVEGADTVVVSSAVRETNVELRAARERGLRVLLRAEALAALMAGRRGVAVAGTHGKTTTTSMLTVAAFHCGVDPSFAIGGDLNEAASNAHHGSGDLFIVEADESDGSFLVYHPQAAVVTNVEADHLDHYGDAASVDRAFEDFVRTIDPDGFLVVCADDPGAVRLAEVARAEGVDVRTYGLSDGADLQLTGLTTSGTTSTYEPVLQGRRLPPVRLAVPGRHLALNSAAALLTGIGLGLPEDTLVEGLGGFTGVRRRMELKGTVARRPRLRRLRPPPHRGDRAAAGGPRRRRRGAARRRLPAAPLQPDPGLRRRVRHRARHRGRGRRHGGLRRGGGPDPGCQRRDRRRGRAAACRPGGVPAVLVGRPRRAGPPGPPRGPRADPRRRRRHARRPRGPATARGGRMTTLDETPVLAAEAPAGRRRGTRLRHALVLLLFVGLVGGLGWVLLASPWLAVDEVAITGTGRTTPQQVLKAAAVPAGTPLAKVDAGAVAARIERLPAVASVEVSRGWPRTLQLDVTERVAVAGVLRDGKVDLVDATGVPFAQGAGPADRRRAPAGQRAGAARPVDARRPRGPRRPAGRPAGPPRDRAGHPGGGRLAAAA